jgi:hypothetical protein
VLTFMCCTFHLALGVVDFVGSLCSLGIWRLGGLFSDEFGPDWAHKLEQEECLCKATSLLEP